MLVLVTGEKTENRFPIGKERRVPYEPVTGLPLCIAPPLDPLRPNDPNNSWHHGHHSEAYFLTLGPEGRAVRNSRLQLCRNIDHNNGEDWDTYHDLYYWSKAPRGSLGRVRLALFGVANAVPGEVLDIRGGGTRPITDEERQRLFKSGELRVQSLFTIRLVFTRFAVDSGMESLTRQELNKYRNTRHEDDRKSLVNTIVGRFLPLTFGPIDERYSEAMNMGMLPPNAPPSPAELVRPMVFSEPTRFAMFSEAVSRIAELREPAA